MKQAAFILILSFLLLAGCTKEDKPITPDCIETTIQTFGIAVTTCETGAAVKEYTFQKQPVYTFYTGFCGSDQSTLVLDADCDTLGVLGGYTGNTKINGIEFSTAIYKRTIWQR